MKKYYLLIAILLLANSAFAQADILVPPSKENIDTGRICSVTIEKELHEPAPENFIKSNNLRHKAGSPLYADGDVVIIEGYLQDSYCLPVSNAKIEIWHANSYGNYQEPFNKGNSDKKIDKNFAGNGITYTNNLGKFYFTTIMPGVSDDNKRYLNISINHEKYQPFASSYIISDDNEDINYIFTQNPNNVKLEFLITIPYVKTTKIY